MEIIEIPFGAKDSELQEWTYTIPKGMEAEIKDGKVIIKRKESEDERIRKELYAVINDLVLPVEQRERFNAWLEKHKEPENVSASTMIPSCWEEEQKEQKPAEWTELTWKDVNDLEEIMNEVRSDYRGGGIGQKSFGLEVLERFRYMKGDELDVKEQKPEWSEEDENNIGKLHRLLVICQSEKKFIPTSEYEKLDKWLKSFRPQSKEEQKPIEWSEDDKFKLEDAITGIDAGIGFYEREGKHPNLLKAIIEAKEWLKSLRTQPKQNPVE